MELVAGCYEQVLLGFAARPSEVRAGETGHARAAAVSCAPTAARQPPATPRGRERPRTQRTALLTGSSLRSGGAGPAGWAFKAPRGRGRLPQPQGSAPRCWRGVWERPAGTPLPGPGNAKGSPEMGILGAAGGRRPRGCGGLCCRLAPLSLSAQG